jgi:hypothetical protein
VAVGALVICERGLPTDGVHEIRTTSLRWDGQKSASATSTDSEEEVVSREAMDTGLDKGVRMRVMSEEDKEGGRYLSHLAVYMRLGVMDRARDHPRL